jgi:hypothetical protein
MSSYKFVQWSKDSTIDGGKLQALSDNDDYLNTLISNIPKGLLSYTINESAPTLYAAGTHYFPRFEKTFELLEARSIKFSLFPGRMGFTGTGVKSCTVSIEIDNAEEVEGFFARHTENFPTPEGFLYDDTMCAPIQQVVDLDIGAHTVKVQFITNASVYPFIGGKFLIEDIGTGVGRIFTLPFVT